MGLSKIAKFWVDFAETYFEGFVPPDDYKMLMLKPYRAF